MTQHERAVKYLYLTTFLTLVITGFAQLPIFGRYHIADIPGLWWLSSFYATLSLHYLAAVMLTGLSFYICMDHFLDGRRERKLTKTGCTKVFMLAGLAITGALMMFKNHSGGAHFNHFFITVLDLLHLSLAVILVIYTVITAISRKYWVRYPIKEIIEKWNPESLQH